MLEMVSKHRGLRLCEGLCCVVQMRRKKRFEQLSRRRKPTRPWYVYISYKADGQKCVPVSQFLRYEKKTPVS